MSAAEARPSGQPAGGNYLVFTEARDTYEDRFTDHRGQHVVKPVAIPSSKAVMDAKALDLEELRTLLHRRPGVVVDGEELPCDWFTWDRLRAWAWRLEASQRAE